jgi:glycosyltransferase involved in cell wall biosynthesis
MDLSVVIPVYNEEESIPELIAWIERVCIASSLSFEIILIDDGSSDSSWKIISSAATTKSFVRGFRFRRNYGKAAALHTGFGGRCCDNNGL